MKAEPFQFDIEDFDDEILWPIPECDNKVMVQCWLANRINIALTSVRKDITWSAYLYFRYGR